MLVYHNIIQEFDAFYDVISLVMEPVHPSTNSTQFVHEWGARDDFQSALVTILLHADLLEIS